MSEHISPEIWAAKIASELGQIDDPQDQATTLIEILRAAMRQAEKEALEWAARSCKRYAAHARGWVTSAPDYVEACEDIRKAFLARIKELSDE